MIVTIRAHRLLLFIITHIAITLCAQETQSLNTLLNTTDKFYGSNDLISLGELYRPNNLAAKGSPYFTSQYTTSSITTKGHIFNNQTTRYNLETGELILLTKVDTGRLIPISVNNSWIDNFSFDDRCFVNIQHLFPSINAKGYYELIYSGSHSFFIKYSKTFISSYNTNTPNGYYSKLKYTYHIYNGVDFITIKNQNEFFKIYKENKKEIKKFLSANNIKFSKASTSQLNLLMQFCNALLEKK
jgi:hypothetical protein